MGVFMRIAILGSIGMLGTMVTRLFNEAGHELITPDLDEVDFTVSGSLDRFYKKYSFDGLVNCAAFTAVDACEDPTKYPLVLKLNAEAVGDICRLSKAKNRWLIHISTDYVFGGTGDKPYAETDPPQPLNAYGRSKREGEKKFLEAGSPGYVVRTSWLYGPNGKHFVGTIAGLLRTKDRIQVVDDQVGGPTYTGSLAHFLLDLAETQPPHGIYHFADSGYTSWYGFTVAIRDILGLKTEVVPVTSEDFNRLANRPAKRPANSRFDLSKARSVARYPMKPWREALEEYLKTVG
jgi:dTDP-4-dehydrorhamnose reductase